MWRYFLSTLAPNECGATMSTFAEPALIISSFSAQPVCCILVGTDSETNYRVSDRHSSVSLQPNHQYRIVAVVYIRLR